MTGNRVCWSHANIQFATQVDVGGLEIDDLRANAVFNAVHQPVPVRRLRGVAGSARARVQEGVIRELFTQEWNKNDPLMFLFTGERGTGKSHLVRWLRSSVGERPDWHIVYIEKRNTSLKRVIERILQGINTPRADALRESLQKASTEINTQGEAMHLLLAKLNHLVRWGPETEIPGLTLSEAELDDLRKKADRLLGDFSFRESLSRPLGPIERITRIALQGTEEDEVVEESDLHLHESDFKRDAQEFEDKGQDLLSLIRSLANTSFRTDISKLCDYYLPRAKAEVFTGQTTDLLDVFEEVRAEILDRGQELVIFIEDLVLLHGIDKQLAQALIVPASSSLCRIRAAIAVTSGYLQSVGTFTDRGTEFSLDIELDTIGKEVLRDFIGRYLNVGRLPEQSLTERYREDPSAPIANACEACPDRIECRTIFGMSSLGHGYYPFNEAAVDRLVDLASPSAFRPRELLREVIDAPLELAESELPHAGAFPGVRFAESLDQTRRGVDHQVRSFIAERSANPESELSLRAFYAKTPPADDEHLTEVARYLGVALLDNLPVADDGITTPVVVTTRMDPVTNWSNNVRLPSEPARRVRNWIIETVGQRLSNGPTGLTVRKLKKGEWQVGSYTIRPTDVRIEDSAGSGALTPAASLELDRNDKNAGILKGILEAGPGNDLSATGSVSWYLDLQNKMSKYEEEVLALARSGSAKDPAGAVSILAVLRNGSEAPGDGVASMLAAIMQNRRSEELNPRIQAFLDSARPSRQAALALLRDQVTASKGAGAPSVLDVAEVWTALKRGVSLTELPDVDPDSDTLKPLFATVRQKQEFANDRAWQDAESVAIRLATVFAADEDLGALETLMDTLVARAHSQGRLPRADALSEYQELRNAVPDSAMETYRRVTSLLATQRSAGSLWRLTQNPLPALTALGQYVGLVTQLLVSLETTLSSSSGSAPEADPEALVDALRDLEATFDLMVEGARHDAK